GAVAWWASTALSSTPSLHAALPLLPSAATSWEASTRTPCTRPARAALARPGPMDSATWRTVTGLSNWRWLPSGSVILGIADSGNVNAIARRGRPCLGRPVGECGRHDQGRTGDLYHVKVAL